MSPLYRFTLRRGFIIKKDPFKLTNLPTYLLAYFLYYLLIYLLTYISTYLLWNDRVRCGNRPLDKLSF